MTAKELTNGLKHFYSQMQSRHLDAKAIQFMNEMPNKVTKIIQQRNDLLKVCKDLIKANEYARKVSLRNETPRGIVWGDARSQLDTTRLKAEIIIAKIEKKG